MKKLFLFLSICATLFFTSCSNFFAPFNENGRIVINFSNKDAAKKILTEVPTNFNVRIYVEIEHTITGEKESQDILFNLAPDIPDSKDPYPVTFENVRSGVWIVSCYVPEKDDNGNIIDKIAFACDSEVTVVPGVSSEVNLRPQYNVISSGPSGVHVKNVELLSNPSKLTYVLDDPLEADDALFELELSNGYKTIMTFDEIRTTFANSDVFPNKVTFSKTVEPDHTQPKHSYATRYYYYIVYTFDCINNGSSVTKKFPIEITLKAKPPVITKQPGKISFKDINYNYEFTVEAELPSYLYHENNLNDDEISLLYYWHNTNSPYTPDEFSKTKITNTYSGKVTMGATSEPQPLFYDYIQCSVLTYDKIGLNFPDNDYSSTETRYGTLENRYLNTSTPNGKYKLIAADIDISSEYSKNGSAEFISEFKDGSWSVPSIEFFEIKKTFENNTYSNEISTGRYYDFTESDNKYNITVARANYTDYSVPCFGYVPYKVSYSFEEDGLTWTNTKTITIPTKLASLPNTLDPKYATDNYDPEFGYNYYERFYNKSDNKYYCKKSDGSLTYSIPNQEKEVNTYKIITEARYYSSSMSTSFSLEHYLNYTGTRNSWSSTEPVNSHKTPISSDRPKVDASYYRIFLSTELTNDEQKRIENYGLDIFISLDAVISVSPSFSNWVVDCTPIRKSLPPVKFSLLQ
ncbi:MAG: hypothetical protein MJ160_01195 [Treponema sp.]|nr:hypothetical protein [Treponema sp.]